MSADDLAEGICSLLRANGVGGPEAVVSHVERLSGGASRETWAFELVDAGARRPLILQRFRPGALAGEAAMATEARLLEVAHRGDVPVPVVLASDDGTHLGAPGMLVERLEGETIARKLLRDDRWSVARDHLGEQSARALARIHALPGDEVPGLVAIDPLQQIRTALDGMGSTLPAFELGIRWLEANRPPSTSPAVVHGDFRLGNLLVDEDGLRAVLDWELAHLGDPAEDLGWFCVRAWRFGSRLAAGGVATREALLSAYAAASGRAVSADALRWWEALGTLRWGMICLVQLQGHLSGVAPSVELATIGRRVCENEWDLLGLLPGPPLEVHEPPTAAEGPDLHGRPTAAELVDVVRAHLDDVRDELPGRQAFLTRVAANALAMVSRELTLEPALRDAHQARLAALGYRDDAELAAAIRAGAHDGDLEAVRATVAASVQDKLLVANPAWLQDP